MQSPSTPMEYWSSGHLPAPSTSRPVATWVAGILFIWMPDCLRTVDVRPSAPITSRGRTSVSLPSR